MKKVISINLGSVVFAIEQDAYDVLASYLEQIKANLTNAEDSIEIISDIERAIAEKFIALKRNEKSAITSADVEQVINEMGGPADFSEGEDVGSTDEFTTPDTKEPVNKRRLYRDTDDAVIAGVASGLSKYFDVDPVIVRLMFVVAIFFNGLGILVYIILWLVVPAATTTSDKYAMRGERMTLKDISERVKKNIDKFDEKDIETAKGVWAKIRDVLNVCFSGMGKVFKVLAKVIRFIAGIILIVAGSLGLAGLVSAYSIILLSDKVFFPTDVQTAIETLQSSTLGIVAMLSSFVTMSVPFLVLIMVGACLVAKRNYFTVQKSITLAVIWIIAIVVAGTTSALQVEKVMQKIGPVEGRFSESRFEVEWQGGRIYGDENEVRIYGYPEVNHEKVTVTGTFDCLDENELINPPDESCLRGLRTADGVRYGLDFVLMSQTLPLMQTGDTITVSGVLTPTERLGAKMWSDLDVEGVVSVTSAHHQP